MSTSGPTDHGPGIRYPPPLPFVVAFVAGLLLEARVRALPIAPGGGSPALAALGWSIVAAAIALGVWAAVTLRRARTAILPHRPASALVRAGPYGLTRNPIYVGFTLAYLGGALVAGSLWPVLLLPLPLLVVTRSIVPREERYLAATFGAEYDAYRSEVPRFVGRR